MGIDIELLLKNIRENNCKPKGKLTKEQMVELIKNEKLDKYADFYQNLEIELSPEYAVIMNEINKENDYVWKFAVILTGERGEKRNTSLFKEENEAYYDVVNKMRELKRLREPRNLDDDDDAR